MIYLDTNVFVYAAINNGNRGKKCREIILKISGGKVEAYTSDLTWDEVVHAIWKKEGKDKALKEGKLFLQLPNVNFLNTSQAIIFKAQQLIEQYILKPRDAIHIATAIVNGIKEIISDDPDFDKVEGVKRVSL